MNAKEKELGELLSRIADELNISPTMHEKAVRSYEAVGKWLGDGLEYDVRIMPQGSMNLGTVVKPLDDSDDYDVDLVCLLKNGQFLLGSQIKHIIGSRLKDHGTYRTMLEPEGKRCWTMQYDEFHMDILPCVSKDKFFEEPNHTAIRLTHKVVTGVYEDRFSNPYAYYDWFEDRMKEILLMKKQMFALNEETEIDKVPTYKMRTPLQQAIQLLKRHRDILFQKDNTFAPISIIITTLAAKAYNGEANVYDAICNILDRMPAHIELRDGEYWVANPVMSEENFADKWNADGGKRFTAFKQWLVQARKDLISNPLALFGIHTIAESYIQSLGKAPVERAVKASGDATKIARESGTLYVDNQTKRLSTTPTTKSTLVKEHTFFGE